MDYKNKTNSIIIFLSLIIISITITYTYYFDHLAIAQSSIIFNDEIYKDKTSLYYVINSNMPSFLFVIINFFLDTGISINLTSSILTFISTFLYLSGIYLITKFITASTILSVLISLTAIFLSKNLGDIDYPTLMFHQHTAGVLSLALCTFIFGLMTLRNLSFAFLAAIFLLSVHLTIGMWIFGILSFMSLILVDKYNKKNIFFIIILLLLVILFYLNWFFNISADLPYKFDKNDYDDYFLYIEAHRTNYGNLNNLHLDYILKSFFLIISILIYAKFFENNFHKNIFFKTLITSISLSGILYFSYKFFPNIFPEIMIQTMPQRFFLLHSVVGYPIILSIVYKFLQKLFIYKKINKNYSVLLITFIISFHIIQQNDLVKERFKNIEEIKNSNNNEKIFWSKVKDLNIKGYALTSNYLCEKTIIYGNLPVLFCFEAMDYIALIPKLATPVKEMINKILDISYENVKIRNTSGVSEKEIKIIYEKKSLTEWYTLKRDFNLDLIIVPKDWKLQLDVVIDDIYKVYKIE